MSDPDLSLIAGLVVDALKEFDDLAPLTPREVGGAEKVDDVGTSLSAVVNIADGNIEELVAQAVGRCGLCLAVDLEEAQEDDSQTVVPFFSKVTGWVDIYENTTSNLLTPTSEPVAGTGTGLRAWVVAAFVCKALKSYELPLAEPQEIRIANPGIKNITSDTNQQAGVKLLRVHFHTKAAMEGRANP